MADFGEAGNEVNARIVYWGIEGAGKTANLRAIHAKLRPDHRGELRRVPTRLDPSVRYTSLPIELGSIGGVRTRIHVCTVPGGEEHAPTRKQLLDQVDGIVFVIDTTRERLDENLEAFEELRSALSAYGRALEEVPLVLQYNKRDQSDPYALEELHRKLQMRGVAAFEAVASQGTAVLQTLTTISKRVIRSLRERAEQDATTAAATAPQPAPLPAAGQAPPPPPAAADDGPDDPWPAGAPLAPAHLQEEGPEAEAASHTAARAEQLFEPSFQSLTRPAEVQASPASPEGEGEAQPGFEIAQVGEAVKIGPRSLRVPLVLEDPDGRRLPVSLTLQIDPGSGD